MSLLKLAKIASLLIVSGTTVSGTGLIATTTNAVQDPATKAGAVQAPKADDGVIEVKPGKFRPTIFERGNLEAACIDEGIIGVRGQSKIVFLKPEWSQVKKGDLICELDTSILQDNHVNQQITKMQALANLENAQKTLQVAEIEHQSAINGTLKNETLAFTLAIKDAENRLQQAQQRETRTNVAKAQIDKLIATKKDGVTPADIVIQLDLDERISEADIEVRKELNAIQLKKSKLDTLTRVTHPRIIRALEAAIQKAESDKLAKRATFALEESKEARLANQIQAAKMYAKTDGFLYFAEDPKFATAQMAEGVVVAERQKIYYVTDFSHMLVNAKVPEAWVDQVVVGQTVQIKVGNARRSEQKFTGTVKSVAPRPLPGTKSEMPIKYYETIVEIENPGDKLRPGMTAEVELELKENNGVLTIPNSAGVSNGFETTRAGPSFKLFRVAVKKPDGTFEARVVKAYATSRAQIGIMSGLEAGEQVAVDAEAKLKALDAAVTISPSAPKNE